MTACRQESRTMVNCLSPFLTPAAGSRAASWLQHTQCRLMFSAMLTDAFRDCDVGITIRYQTNGKLCIRQKARIWHDRDCLFANECALNTGSEADMQCFIYMFSTACTNLSLTISTKKTEVLHQPAPGKPYVEPNITVKSQRLNVVNKLLTQNTAINYEINARIAKASAASGRRHVNVWNGRGISLQTELKVYRAIVVIILLTLVYA